MVWPIMGDACRRSSHLKDGVEASQRVRSSGRSAPSSTLAFNEQSGNCSGPEVGFAEIAIDLPQGCLGITSGLTTTRDFEAFSAHNLGYSLVDQVEADSK